MHPNFIITESSMFWVYPTTYQVGMTVHNLGGNTRLVQLVTQLVTRVPLHGPKTLVKKNGLVRPLVTTPSNGPVRKLVTRFLSELITTSVGNKLQA